MTNEEKILEALSSMQSDLTTIKGDVNGLKAGQQRLEGDVAGLKADVNSLKAGQQRLEEGQKTLASQMDKMLDHQVKDVYTLVQLLHDKVEHVDHKVDMVDCKFDMLNKRVWEQEAASATLLKRIK